MTAVIDFHTHLFPGGAFDEVASKELQARGLLHDRFEMVCGQTTLARDELEAFYRSQGLDKVVVLAEVTPLTTGVSSNEFVGEYCYGSDLLVPFCSPNPYLHRDLAHHVEQLVDRYGFRGIKVYPSYLPISPGDPRLYPMYAMAEQRGLPVMFHTGVSTFPGARLRYADPLLIDEVAVDFPRLRVVLAHGGRDLWFAEAFALARTHEHVHLEVSGLPPSRLLDYFPKLQVLEGKVVFGTDFPVLRSITDNVQAIRELPLRESFVHDILAGAASRLLARAA